MTDEPKMTLTLADMAPMLERSVRAMFGDARYEAAKAQIAAESEMREQMRVRLNALEEFLCDGEQYEHLSTVAMTRILYPTP